MMVIGFFCRTTPLLSFCNDRAVPNRHSSSRAGKPGEQMNQVERERERGRESLPTSLHGFSSSSLRAIPLMI